MSQQITPCLWFDGQAEEAAKFYVGLFPNSSLDRVDRSPADTHSGREGTVLTVSFTLRGLQFLGLNGGPMYKFTEAVSFQVPCDDQAEIDRYWAAFSDGGTPSRCGWIKDRFGLSWQVFPKRLPQLLGDKDRGKAKRAMQSMMTMGKIDLAELERAAAAG